MGRDLSINGKDYGRLVASSAIDMWIDGEYTLKEVKELCLTLIDMNTSGIKLAGHILVHTADEFDEPREYSYRNR